MRRLLVIALGVALAGCGTDPAPGPQYVANFNPPDVTPGYTRFLTPTMKAIGAGTDVEYCQWVAGPSASAQDVLDLSGLQSATGHHAILYATTATQYPVGESHICTERDTLAISFVGAVGGEGNASSGVKLPDGLFFRLPAGQALMLNTHWLNATDQPVDAQAVVDVKFTPASDQRQTADLFANNGLRFQIAPGKATYDANCVLQDDLNVVLAFNHMHEHGMTAFSELIRPDGTKDMVVADDVWRPELQFNAHYSMFTVDAPMVAHAGDTYHTHCEWQNTTAAALQFPQEMCTGGAFYFPSQGHISCSEGAWPAK